ncbi:MAG: polyketide antibiotic transporter [Dermatophilaceae bacterium]
MTRSSLAGTATLVRLAVRRDRLLLPVGILGITAFAVSSAQATLALYPTMESMGSAVQEIFASPAAVALYGPMSDPSDPDALAVVKTTMFGAVLLAIFGYAIVRRHTRSEEEDGRFELLGGVVVGRRAPLVAAVVVAAAAVLATCLLTALGYAAIGMDRAGSVAAAAGWAAVGLAFVGITAVAAQVSSTARSCAGMAMGALGLLFLLRAIADSRPALPGWLGWVSPVGWTSKADAFATDRWWVSLLGAAALAVCLVVAFVLLERRDLGAGLVAPRRGAARAGATLGSPAGLSWRLARNGLIGWAFGFAVGGVVVGSLASSAVDMIKDPAIADLLRKMGGGEGLLVDVYVTTEIGFIAVIAAAYGVTAIGRWRAEETRMHAEPVLATATTRLRYAAGHVGVALLGTAALLLVLGLALGLADAGAGGDGAGVGRVLPAAAVRIPAVWVCVGVVTAAMGWLPRWTAAIGWGALAFFLVVGEFGAVLGLPGWLLDLAPFTHVPRMPVEQFAWAPTLGLLAVAAALIGAGLAGFRRRDIG